MWFRQPNPIRKHAKLLMDDAMRGSQYFAFRSSEYALCDSIFREAGRIYADANRDLTSEELQAYKKRLEALREQLHRRVPRS